MRPAVFLDRDGVLNRLILAGGRRVAPRTFRDFSLLPRVARSSRESDHQNVSLVTCPKFRPPRSPACCPANVLRAQKQSFPTAMVIDFDSWPAVAGDPLRSQVRAQSVTRIGPHRHELQHVGIGQIAFSVELHPQGSCPFKELSRIQADPYPVRR